MAHSVGAIGLIRGVRGLGRPYLRASTTSQIWLEDKNHGGSVLPGKMAVHITGIKRGEKHPAVMRLYRYD